MVTATNILYSVAAARRILGIYYPEIKVAIQVWAKVILVISDGRRPRFISKKVFKQHFVDRRKQEAKALEVTPNGYHAFTVTNPRIGSEYKVQSENDAIYCSCEDYKNQLSFWGKAACKHSYAVLFNMGYSDLSQYLRIDHKIPATVFA